MRRRELIGIIALASIVARYESSAAQTAPKTIRLAYLAPIRIPHLVEALTGGLRDLGYVEGQNLSIEYRFAGENPEHFDLLAIELVKLAPQVIVTVATPATLAGGERPQAFQSWLRRRAILCAAGPSRASRDREAT